MHIRVIKEKQRKKNNKVISKAKPLIDPKGNMYRRGRIVKGQTYLHL